MRLQFRRQSCAEWAGRPAASMTKEASVQMRAVKMVYESCAERAESPAMLAACKLPDDEFARSGLRLRRSRGRRRTQNPGGC